MHPRLLTLYNQELGHLREMAAEFAREFPKIASRLTLDAIEVTDPYVERLLEGFAFLAARVQLKIEAEFPNFVQHLLEVAYPNLAASTPSMAIVRFVPDLAEPALARGLQIARGSRLYSRHLRGADTACDFRTAHDVTLWPLIVDAAQYFSFAPDLPLAHVPALTQTKGGIRISLSVPEGTKMADVKADRLCFFISAPDEAAYRLYELIFGAGLGVLVVPAASPVGTAAGHEYLPPGSVQAVGFGDDESLLPATRPGFRGYRLLQEYAALPQRYLFFEVRGLAPALARCGGTRMEVVLPFRRGDAGLEQLIDRDSIALNCTPVVNLFRKRLDRVDVSGGQVELHVIADRMRPIDFEVREIESVTAYGGPSIGEQEFRPLYAATHSESAEHRAYFTVQREPRVLSAKSRLEGNRSSYIGSEVYLSLVDRDEAPFRGDLRQLAIDAWCSNRDLPLLLPAGGPLPENRNDFQPEADGPFKRVQCLRGPSAPRGTIVEGRRAWALVSQLNLNYLSLLDTNEQEGAAALRAILGLYCDQSDAALRRQGDGIRSGSARRVSRRIAGNGPLALVSGVEITLTVDDLAFQGASAFLLGRVLEALLARHAAINSFIELVVRSAARPELMQGTPIAGQRPIL